MPVIDIDATNWKSILELYGALFPVLGAPEWHGTSINALVDSMVWGGINKLEPPYTIRIFGTSKLPKEVHDKVELTKKDLTRACAEFRSRKGRDVGIRFETYP